MLAVNWAMDLLSTVSTRFLLSSAGLAFLMLSVSHPADAQTTSGHQSVPVAATQLQIGFGAADHTPDAVTRLRGLPIAARRSEIERRAKPGEVGFADRAAAAVRAERQGAFAPVDSLPGGGNPKRRALLIGGLAASMAAYGYFILEFNNSRGESGAAEAAYQEDVRLNAQTYVDQGIEMDEIQTFRDWQAAYDDAKSAREWAARAGFLAIVIGFFAILDAATTYDGPSPRASGMTITPTLDLAPVNRDLMVGARLKF